MSVVDVLPDAAFDSSPVRTKMTLEWLFSCVYPEVPPLILGKEEPLATDRAYTASPFRLIGVTTQC